MLAPPGTGTVWMKLSDPSDWTWYAQTVELVPLRT